MFADRYHARALTTPREVRNAIVYVLNNRRHHPRGAQLGEGFDPYSSAVWFDGWKEGPLRWPKPLTRPPPVVPPRTWLLAKSWRRHPPPSLSDVPGPSGR